MSIMTSKKCLPSIHLTTSSPTPNQSTLENIAATQPAAFIDNPLHHVTQRFSTPITSMGKLSVPSDTLGTWCHWCCDSCDPSSSHVCVNCGAVACCQTRPGGPGCISYRSVQKGWAFLCPLCVIKRNGRENGLPYTVIRYGMSKVAKKAWPACVVHMTSGNNDYLKDLINIDLANQYKGYIDNVSHSHFFTPSLSMCKV